MLSCSVVPDSVTPWTIACHVLLSMGFPKQEYWSREQFPPPGDLPNPQIKILSPAAPALSGIFFLPLSHLGSPNWGGGLVLARGGGSHFLFITYNMRQVRI